MTDEAGNRVTPCSLCGSRICIDTDNYVNFGNMEVSPGLCIAEVCADCIIDRFARLAALSPESLVNS